MQTVTIHDAKTNLSKYIAKVKSGGRVYIGSFGRPEVVLLKIPSSFDNQSDKRVFGVAKGKVKELTQSFSDKTEMEVGKLMLGEA